MDFTAKVQALLVMGCEHFSLDCGTLSHVVGEQLQIVERRLRVLQNGMRQSVEDLIVTGIQAVKGGVGSVMPSILNSAPKPSVQQQPSFLDLYSGKGK